MSTVALLITSQNEVIFSGTVSYVIMRSAGGEIGIFPKHAPLLTQLTPGHTRFQPSEELQEQILYVSSGIAEVLPNKVTMLVDLVKRSHEIDEQLVQQMRTEAQATLAKHPQGSATYQEALEQLNITLAQLQVLKMLSKKK